MANKINIGDRIPSFSINDYESLQIDDEDLIGSPFVLYFYPKDDTPGCTKEACDFRDSMDKLDQLDTLVIGVSPDNSTSHNKFIEKYDINFTLLCDEQLDLARKFGVVQERESGERKVQSIMRSTFVIDSLGIVRWAEVPVSVEGHVMRVLKAVEQVVRQEAG